MLSNIQFTERIWKVLILVFICFFFFVGIMFQLPEFRQKMQSFFPSIPKSDIAGSEPLDWDAVFKSKWLKSSVGWNRTCTPAFLRHLAAFCFFLEAVEEPNEPTNHFDPSLVLIWFQLVDNGSAVRRTDWVLISFPHRWKQF